MEVKYQITDDELIVLYQNGDEDAFKQLFNRHHKKIYGYIFNKIRDKAVADDLFQETFLKVIIILKNQNYCNENKFVNWILRICHNVIIDHFRKKKVPTISKVVSPKGNTVDILDILHVDQGSDMVKKEAIRDIQKLIEYLPFEQREVVRLKHCYDLSFKEIADMTNVSINTALGRMRYAVINLRRLADKHEVFQP